MRGIIFAEPSIRGLVNRTKSQTRRLARGRVNPFYKLGETLFIKETWWRGRWVEEHHYNDHDGVSRVSSYWCHPRPGDMESIAYVANGTPPAERCEHWDRMSAMFMPQWAARFHVKITDVKRQHLHDMTEKDAAAEGVEEYDGLLDNAAIISAAQAIGCCAEDSLAWYAAAWDELHRNDRVRVYKEFGESRGHPHLPYYTVKDDSTLWAANPEVDVYTFEVIAL